MADEGEEHVNARNWLERYAERIGVAPPSADEFRVLLDLAGVAAHSSQRVAAPVACWLAAQSGLEPEAALAAAHGVSGNA